MGCALRGGNSCREPQESQAEQKSPGNQELSFEQLHLIRREQRARSTGRPAQRTSQGAHCQTPEADLSRPHCSTVHIHSTGTALWPQLAVGHRAASLRGVAGQKVGFWRASATVDATPACR